VKADPGMNEVQLLTGDARTVLAQMPEASVDCVVTSPPYWRQRDYGVTGQLGLENTIEAYVCGLVAVFDQVRRVLKPTGTCWLNLGDSYTCGPCGPRTNRGRLGGRSNASTTRQGAGGKRGLPAKNLAGIPWRVALALQDQGWILRSEIIWHKPNAIPESVNDRPARRHEHLFLLTASPRYYFDLDPIRQPYTGNRSLARRTHRSANRPHTITTPWPPPAGKYDATEAFLQPPGTNLQPGRPHTSHHLAGRNPGTVWSLATRPSRHHHYAAFPIDIPLRAIAAGCPPRGAVLDPFSGSGTTILAARKLNRTAIGIDLNASFHQITQQRLAEHHHQRSHPYRGTR
jgi:DNA modification methylase